MCFCFPKQKMVIKKKNTPHVQIFFCKKTKIVTGTKLARIAKALCNPTPQKNTIHESCISEQPS